MSAEGTPLSTESVTELAPDTRSFEVQVQNQGESDESGVTVTVTVDGVEGTATIDTIAAGATESVAVELSSSPPSGSEVDVSVTISPVPGEGVTDNNSAEYRVVFG